MPSNNLVSVKIDAVKSAQFDATVRGAERAMSVYARKLQELGNQSKAIAAYKAHSASVESYRKAVGDSENSLDGFRSALAATEQRLGGKKRSLEEAVHAHRDLEVRVKKGEILSKAERKQHTELAKKIRKTRSEVRQLTRDRTKLNGGVKKASRGLGKLRADYGNQVEALDKVKRGLAAAKISTDDLVGAQQRLQRSMARLDAIESRGARFRRVAERNRGLRQNAIGEVGSVAAMGYAVAKPMVTAATFEQEMARVGALTYSSALSSEQNAARRKGLEQEALRLGKSTQFTASEVSQSMGFLAMAGFSPKQIKESTASMLELNAAGGGLMSLGETADIASNILSGFNIKASKMGNVANVLAATFTSSNTNLMELGEAMKYVAPNASAAGSSIEEVAAMAGLLGNEGVKASMAGTALRSVFSRLAGPMKQGAKQLAALGISTKDSKGNLRSIPVLLREIGGQLDRLGTADRTAAIKRIFGQEASASATILLKNSKSGALDQYIAKLRAEKAVGAGEGMTTRIARSVNDTTVGDYKRLMSAVEGAAITFGRVFLPAVRAATEAITAGTDRFSRFIEGNRQLVVVVGGTAAGLIALKAAAVAGSLAFSVLSDGYNLARAALGLLRPSMIATNVTMAASRMKMLAMAAAQRTVAVATRAWAATQWVLNAAMSANPIGLAVTAVAALAAGATALWRNWDVVGPKLQAAWDWIKRIFKGGVQWISDLISAPMAALRSLGNAASGIFGGDSASESGDQGPAPIRLPVAPSPRRVEVANRFGDVSIEIHTQPGQSSQSIADEVLEKLKAHQRDEMQAAMFDEAG